MNFRFAAFSVVLVTVVLAVDRLPGADGSLVGHWRLAGNGRDYSGNGNHAVNILNPIQPLAAGMNPFELKQEFGGTLCFDGGIDIQELLPKAPKQVVRNGGEGDDRYHGQRRRLHPGRISHDSGGYAGREHRRDRGSCQQWKLGCRQRPLLILAI